MALHARLWFRLMLSQLWLQHYFIDGAIKVSQFFKFYEFNALAQRVCFSMEEKKSIIFINFNQHKHFPIPRKMLPSLSCRNSFALLAGILQNATHFNAELNIQARLR